MTVGVRPWVANYNIPLTRQDSLGTGDKGNTDESNTDMLLRQGACSIRIRVCLDTEQNGEHWRLEIRAMPCCGMVRATALLCVLAEG